MVHEYEWMTATKQRQGNYIQLNSTLQRIKQEHGPLFQITNECNVILELLNCYNIIIRLVYTNYKRITLLYIKRCSFSVLEFIWNILIFRNKRENSYAKNVQKHSCKCIANLIIIV